MLLAIDSGNTNGTFGLFSESGELLKTWRLSTSATRTEDEYAVWFTQMLSLEGLEASAIQDIIVANVVPATQQPLARFCQNVFGKPPLCIGDSNVHLGIEIVTDTPQEAGDDRVVNVIAGHDIIKGPGVVIDFGTATTFDVMDAAGNYMGGIIAPGVNLSLKALSDAAAQLPMIPVEKPEKVMGKRTKEAMQSGIYWGYVSLIEGLITRLENEIGTPLKVIATGGLSHLFAESIERIEAVDLDLTLRGLWIIHQRSRQAHQKEAA